MRAGKWFVNLGGPMNFFKVDQSIYHPKVNVLQNNKMEPFSTKCKYGWWGNELPPSDNKNPCGVIGLCQKSCFG